MEIKVYTPRRDQGFFSLLKEIIVGFWEGRELASRLFKRDLKVSYRKSYLGGLWLFLPPLATAGLWVFLNQQRVVAIQKTPMIYAGFALCGTILWSCFAEAIAKPIQRYQNAMSMMSKLNFPREAIVLASFYDLGFSLCIKLVILIPGLWAFGYPPDWHFIPAIIFIIVLMLGGLALGIFLSPLGLLYTDIGKALPIVLPFAMYLTPVIYPLRTGGWLAFLQKWNPVTPFLERARSLLGGYEFNMQEELMWWSLGTVLILVLGLIMIRIALPVIVERSGS